MTRIIFTPESARTVLQDVIRTELRGTWERGMDTAPNGPHALDDRGAPTAYNAIMEAVDDLTSAIATLWREKTLPPAAGPGTEHDTSTCTPPGSLTYRLTCGCTDWCNCAPCLNGNPHGGGEAWSCDTHGRTTLAWLLAPPHPVIEAPADSLAVCHSAEPFTLAPGHRMRAAKCLVCHLMIGSGQAAVLGVAALAGDACRCGGVVSDLFLIHASHMPLDPDGGAAAVHRGLACPVCHPAD